MVSTNIECEVAIIGGGVGGVAAGLAAAMAGLKVVVIEESSWLGGQITSQAVSALDEHKYIEQISGTQSYANFRMRIRKYYENRYHPAGHLYTAGWLNPGNGWVSRLCFEPRVGLKVINELLAPYIRTNLLEVYLGWRAHKCNNDLGRISSVEIINNIREILTVYADYFIDATELGELLRLAGLQYAVGAESVEDTGEPHASKDGPHPNRVQSFTYCFLVEFCPGENHLITQPSRYHFNRQAQPYSLTLTSQDGRSVSFGFFKGTSDITLPFWTYRRVFDHHLLGSLHKGDIALINWDSNDYRRESIIDQKPENVRMILNEAKNLSLGFLYWLQTEIEREDGNGYGYPELRLLKHAVGTQDGLAKRPYVRESRRILGLRRILEQDISVETNPEKKQTNFHDSVGIGWYPIDLHPCVGSPAPMNMSTIPFQIPLGALIPVDCQNLIAACKNISTTHITNGAYRLHPVEWSIGTAAGFLTAFCIHHQLSPRIVHDVKRHLHEFQSYLASNGVDLKWPDEILDEV